MTMPGADRPRVIVSGSRRHRDRDLIWGTLDQVYRRFGPMTLVEGGAEGADTLAHAWAVSRAGAGWQVSLETVRADWYGPCRPCCVLPWPDGHNGVRRSRGHRASYCQMAGIYRNHDMGDLPDVRGYVAFPLPGGTGTADMISYAQSKEIRDLAI
jgi:YspA, cpYpsA-related SLOG family